MTRSELTTAIEKRLQDLLGFRIEREKVEDETIDVLVLSINGYRLRIPLRDDLRFALVDSAGNSQVLDILTTASYHLRNEMASLIFSCHEAMLDPRYLDGSFVPFYMEEQIRQGIAIWISELEKTSYDSHMPLPGQSVPIMLKNLPEHLNTIYRIQTTFCLR